MDHHNGLYEKNIRADRRYLLVPVRGGEDKVVFQLLLDGQMVREFDVELDRSGTPDWWAYYDLSMFAGSELLLRAAQGDLTAEARPWLDQALVTADEPRGLEDLYREALRPQFHFTTRRGWTNDPNGMVYQAGEWHLFYQHNPFGVYWGNMHWGHAVSADLLHWQELPTALYQRSLQDMAFTGCGVVDENNSAGLQTSGEPPLVVIYTSTGRSQCLAYSNDHGRTLEEYEGNPVLALRHLSRDPKVIPYGEAWRMIIYEVGPTGEDTGGGYAFYRSADLKHWERTSFLPGYFECPELFELPLDGDERRSRWVMHGCLYQKSRSNALIGDFDGEIFTGREENFTAHYGPHFYAPQNFSNTPDGRVIMIGWLAGAQYPGMPFSQGMTVPLELSLRSTPQGARLCFNPARELEALRAGSLEARAPLTVAAANELLAQVSGELLDVELTLRAQAPVTLDVRGWPITYDPAAATITFAEVTAPLPGEAGTLSLRVLVDRSVTEVFANGGTTAFASMTIFEDPHRPLRLEGNAEVQSLAVHTLKSIWE